MAEKDIPAVDKEKSLLLAISQIEKEFGKGTIMRLGANAAVTDVPAISTGSRAAAAMIPDQRERVSKRIRC